MTANIKKSFNFLESFSSLIGKCEEIVGFEYQHDPECNIDNDSNILTLNINYGASRDVVWNPDEFKKELKKYLLKNIDSESNKNNNNYKDLLNYLDLENLECILSFPEENNNYNSSVAYEYWLSNKNKNFAIIITGSMGEFVDDEFDAQMDVEVRDKYPKEKLSIDMERSISNYIKRRALEFKEEMETLINRSPKEYKNTCNDIIREQLSNMDIFSVYFAKKQKELLKSSLKVNQDKKINNKTQKSSKKMSF